MKYTFLIIWVLLIQQINAQESKKYTNFEVSGDLISSEDRLPLESATVYLEKTTDSTVVNYDITDQKGNFKLEGKTDQSSLILNISYVGFKAYKKEIDIKETGVFDLKEVLLEPNTSELEAVVLKVSPPVLIKKDTIEFNARSFKTKKDANVEDLLKKTPGIEIDEEGKITVNGKPVTKVLINGKSFFGNDPTIATKNLPKDIIEKIQVVDTKTKSEAFTGEESDGENKTINLVIKKENNKGVFGRAAVGYGTDDRYQYAGMYNYFDNDQKISALAGGNNINSPGFSYGEIRDMFGSNNGVDARSLGDGDGITTSDNIGANYSDTYGKDMELNANYFYAASDSYNDSSSFSEVNLEESTYFTDYTSNSTSQKDKHTANLEFDIERDSTWLINISPSFDYNMNSSISTANSLSYAVDNDTINTINTFERTSTNENNEGSFKTDVDITRNYGSGGGFLRFRNSSKISDEDQDNKFKSERIFTDEDSEDEYRNTNTIVKNSSLNIDNSFTYRLPLISKKVFVDFKYTYQRNRSISEKTTKDYDTISEMFDVFNSDLSTDYTNINKSHIPGLSFSYKGEKLRIRLANYYRTRTLENNDYLRPEVSLTRSFKNYEQFTNLRYKFNSKTFLNFNYRYQNRPPSLRNMQEFETISSSGNIIIGNAELKPQTSHNGYLYLNYFDHQKQLGVNGYLYGNIVNNQTVSNVEIDTLTLKSTTRYTNVDGNYYMTGSIQGNKRIKFNEESSLSLELRVRPRHQKSISYNNGLLYSTIKNSLEPTLNLRYDWRNVLELSTRYSPEYTNTRYNIDGFEDRTLIIHQVGLNTTTKVPEKLEWSNSLVYNYNPNVTEGFQKSSWLWNMTVAYSVLKDKGLISLKAYDILNQNTNARRILYSNQIIDRQSTVLQQYFMLGFSWKFNTLGDKASKKTSKRTGRRRRRY